MTVCRFLATALLLLALSLGTGCGGNNARALGPETDDPTFIEGRQYKRQGRQNEALNAFLKVIEQRGQREAPESHLEAGQLYLEHMKNPLIAIYHFQQYLALQPNSAETPRVRGLVGRAMREFAATIPGRLLEDQSVRVSMTEETERMRREIEELRAELATLRGGGAVPVNRRQNPSPVDPKPRSNAFAGLESGSVPSHASPPAEERLLQPAPPSNASRVPAARPATSGGRTHTVVEKDNLWGIARRYYGPSPTNAQVNGIYEANRTVMRDTGDLKPGMVLRIP